MTIATFSGLSRAAGADPIADKRAQAQALETQIAAINIRVTDLGEALNGAQLRLDAAQQALTAIQAKVTATEAQIAGLRSLVGKRAASVYRRQVSGQAADSLSFDNAARMMSRKHYAASGARHDAKLLGELADAKADLATQQAAAEQAQLDADAVHQKIQATTATAEAAAASQQALLEQVQGEIGKLVQEEMNRRQAEALRMARLRYSTSPEAFPNLGPPGSAAAQAIAFAKLQLGKTYLYAGTGIEHFDCSGLVMMAYRSAGVDLPHYSGAQYALLPHVPLNSMQPGDLVFWGTAGSKHVAIYLGDGRIIESGGTGHNTHIGPIWGNPSGAARVTN